MERMRKASGFTLLEVLVCLVILGVSFGVLFETFAQSKRIWWRADDAAAASRIAHNLFADPEFVQDAIDAGQAEGEVKGEKDWRYSVEVVPLRLSINGQEPMEIPSMVELKLCLRRVGEVSHRRMCLSRWYRK